MNAVIKPSVEAIDENIQERRKNLVDAINQVKAFTERAETTNDKILITKYVQEATNLIKEVLGQDEKAKQAFEATYNLSNLVIKKFSGLDHTEIYRDLNEYGKENPFNYYKYEDYTLEANNFYLLFLLQKMIADNIYRGYATEVNISLDSLECLDFSQQIKQV